MTKNLENYRQAEVCWAKALVRMLLTDEPRQEEEIFEISMKFEDHILVMMSYEYGLMPEYELLTEYDLEGVALVKIPLTSVINFYTDSEAESIMRMLEDDARLLSYAR